MKLKYKKIVLLIGTCIIGVNMVVYSANSQTKTAQSQKNKYMINAQKTDPENDESGNTFDANLANQDTIIEGDIFTIANGILEKDAYENIDNLMKQYYIAKLKNKLSDFEPLVNSTDYINIKDNGRRTKYIEAYQNITCYTRKGIKDNTFIVYVYHETKFKDIKTVAPGLDRFYVKLKDDRPYIFFGEVDNATTRFIKETDESEEVLDLVSKVNERYAKAVEKDSKLFEFKMKLEEPVG